MVIAALFLTRSDKCALPGPLESPKTAPMFFSVAKTIALSRFSERAAARCVASARPALCENRSAATLRSSRLNTAGASKPVQPINNMGSADAPTRRRRQPLPARMTPHSCLDAGLGGQNRPHRLQHDVERVLGTGGLFPSPPLALTPQLTSGRLRRSADGKT